MASSITNNMQTLNIYDSQTLAAACANCGASECPDGSKLKFCEWCLNERYCTKRCLKTHWPTHKKFCTKEHKAAKKTGKQAQVPPAAKPSQELSVEELAQSLPAAPATGAVVYIKAVQLIPMLVPGGFGATTDEAKKVTIRSPDHMNPQYWLRLPLVNALCGFEMCMIRTLDLYGLAHDNKHFDDNGSRTVEALSIDIDPDSSSFGQTICGKKPEGCYTLVRADGKDLDYKIFTCLSMYVRSKLQTVYQAKSRSAEGVKVNKQTLANDLLTQEAFEKYIISTPETRNIIRSNSDKMQTLVLTCCKLMGQGCLAWYNVCLIESCA